MSIFEVYTPLPIIEINSFPKSISIICSFVLTINEYYNTTEVNLDNGDITTYYFQNRQMFL